MMERVEINNDLTRSEPIREVRQTKDARTEEATKKKFVAELERRLSRKKKEKRGKEKDRIILHEDEDGSKEKSKKEKENKQRDKAAGKSVPSPDGLKGKDVDFIA